MPALVNCAGGIFFRAPPSEVLVMPLLPTKPSEPPPKPWQASHPRPVIWRSAEPRRGAAVDVTVSVAESSVRPASAFDDVMEAAFNEHSEIWTASNQASFAAPSHARLGVCCFGLGAHVHCLTSRSEERRETM